MKIAIESTHTMTSINGCPSRLWEGVTAAGTKVWVFVQLISVDADSEDTGPLEAELLEVMPDHRGHYKPFNDLHGRPHQ